MFDRRKMQLSKVSYSILLFSLLLLTLPSCTSIDDAVGPKPLDSLLGCNMVGTAAEKMLGKKKFEEVRAVSTITCVVVAQQMKSQRAKALKREKDIDELIAKEKMRVNQLRKKNDELKKEIKNIEHQTDALKTAMKVDKSNVIKMAALIQNQKDAIPERIKIIEKAIAKAEVKLKSSELTSYQKETLPKLIIALKERKTILENSLNAPS